jgi:uncharacterized protein YqhQ
MIYFIYKTILTVLMRSTILVGGQAVIEGVMMRVPGAYATAVRTTEGKIKLQYNDFQSIISTSSFFSLPIVRGGIHLYESMKIGYQTLEWSVDVNMPTINKKNQFLESLVSILSILFAIGLFFGTPIISAYFIQDYFELPKNDTLTFNIISGLVRITLFLSYLFAISFLKDVKRLFEFHGAEHKTVYNFESGKEITIANAKTFSKEHPRCGTSFVFIVMLVSIVSFACIDAMITNFLDIELRIINRLLIHIPCIPLVAGLSYEVLKITARYQKYFIFRMLAYPGLLLQKITTQTPSDDQFEVAIAALNSAFKDNLSKFQGKEFNAEAIG